MTLRPSSVRVRLTLWYTVILAGIVLALFLAVFFFVKTNLIRQLDRQVESEFRTVSQSLAEEPNELSEFETEGAGRTFQVLKGNDVLFETLAFRQSGLRVADPATPAAGRTVKSPAGTMFRLKTGPAGPDLALAVAGTGGAGSTRPADARGHPPPRPSRGLGARGVRRIRDGRPAAQAGGRHYRQSRGSPPKACRRGSPWRTPGTNSAAWRS